MNIKKLKIDIVVVINISKFYTSSENCISSAGFLMIIIVALKREADLRDHITYVVNLPMGCIQASIYLIHTLYFWRECLLTSKTTSRWTASTFGHSLAIGTLFHILIRMVRLSLSCCDLEIPILSCFWNIFNGDTQTDQFSCSIKNSYNYVTYWVPLLLYDLGSCFI